MADTLDDVDTHEDLAEAAQQDPKVRDVLAQLEINGRLTPGVVLEEATSEDSPLHRYFTWDDRRAAGAWRLEQARRLIRSVRVTVVIQERTIAIPSYVRDPSQPGSSQGLIAIPSLKTDRFLARKAVKAEFSAAKARVDRAVALARSVGMFGLVDEILEPGGLMERVEAAVEACEAAPPADE